MRKHFLSWALALVALLFVSIPQAQARAGKYYVSDYAGFELVFRYGLRPNNTPLESGDTIKLIGNINQTYDPSRAAFDVGIGQTLTFDLNGYTVRYDATESALVQLITILEGATLNIFDSKGGGQFILNDHDGAGTTHMFVLNKNATLNVYGGSLLCLYNEKAWSRCKAIYSRGAVGAEVNIYDGLISSISGSSNDAQPGKINIYGGTIGMEDFLSETYDAALWHDPFNGTIKGGKIYSLYGTAALADETQGGYTKALAADTKVYIDGVLTPSNQLVPERSAYENKLVEVFYEPDFTISNIAVTSANAADILGDGKVSFNLATNTLYLRTADPNTMNTINGNINYSDFTLNIVVDGKWKLNGRIVGHDGNLVISAAHPQVMAEENADLLSIEANSTPISLNGKHFTAKHRVRVVINAQNTAVSCGMFAINNAWFDAWGKKPMVDCQNSMIQNATIKTGSLKDNDVVQIEPNIQKYVLFLMKNIDEAGVVTGDGYYPEGTQVTITVIPNSGYHFLRWDDGETDQQRYVTMNQDIVLTAIFEADAVIPTYSVSIQSDNDVMGTVSGMTGDAIQEGTEITISAAPKSGYQFLYWKDSRDQVVSGNATFTWTVTRDEIFTAHFRVQPPADAYMLWVCGTQVTGSNSADILGDGVWCYDHETRTLTVMKDATYDITNDGFIEDWAGSSTSEPLLVNVGNHKIEATCTTTDNTIRNGIVGTKGMTFTGTTYHGITFTAQNMYAANFSKPLTVTGHMDLTLNLKNTTDWGKDNFKTAVLLAGVTPSLIVDGANLYINSGVGESAGSGYKATNKTDQAANLSLNNASIQWGSISSQDLGIMDESPKYEINYITPSLESLCLTSVFGLSFFEGTHFNLYAYPATGYKFVSWSDGNTDNPRLIIMPAHDVYLDPIVEVDDSQTPKGAIINANATEGQGSITGFTSGWYAEGTELTITAVAANGYQFVEWSDGVKDNPYHLTVVDKQNISITACFAPIKEGIDNISQEPTANSQKLIIDGILYIIRPDGKIYNAQGAEIK